MKKMLPIMIFIIVSYVVVQYLATTHYIKGSTLLARTTWVGSQNIGSGPPFKFWADGDSLGAGIGASSFDTSIIGRVARKIATSHTVTLSNQSVSGARMARLLSTKLPEQRQDLIVLVISSNDLLHNTNLAVFERTTREVLDRYQPLTKQLVVIGPGNVGGSPLIPLIAHPFYLWKQPKYVNALKKITHSQPNVVYIDPVNLPKGTLNEYGPTTSSVDQFHLSDEGHRLWADLIIAKLIPDLTAQ